MAHARIRRIPCAQQEKWHVHILMTVDKAGMLDLVYMDQFNILNKYNDVQSISLVHICRQHWT